MSNFDDNPYAVTNATDDYGYNNQSPPHIPDYFVLSIISIFFCLPFGIAAIIFASKTKSLKESGQYQAALEQAGKAKIFTWLALGLGGALLIIQIVLQFALIFG